jgi:hypothetical protein
MQEEIKKEEQCNCICHKEGTVYEEKNIRSTHAQFDCHCRKEPPKEQNKPEEWEERFDIAFPTGGLTGWIGEPSYPADLCCGDECSSDCDKRKRKKIKSFIKAEKAKSKLEGEQEFSEKIIEEIREYLPRMLQVCGGKLPFVIFNGKADEDEKINLYKEGLEDAIKIIRRNNNPLRRTN